MRASSVFLGLALSNLVWAQSNCNDEDKEALRVLRHLMHSAHSPGFAARAVVQTAVASQQIVVTRGVPDTDGAYSIQIPEHASDCNNLSHRLLQDSVQGCGVAQWYKFRVERQMLGGDKATVITALPKDVYRHGFQVVVDEANAIVLRSTTFSGANALENVELRALSLANEGSESPAELGLNSIVPDTDLPSASDPDPDPDPDLAWLLGWVPAGFEVASSSIARGVQTRTYTDGLSTFSVFVEYPKGDIRLGEGVVNRGATLAYTRGLSTRDGAALISVIGEIPVNTARMLVEGVKWSANGE